jgi:hypothetical protein
MYTVWQPSSLIMQIIDGSKKLAARPTALLAQQSVSIIRMLSPHLIATMGSVTRLVEVLTLGGKKIRRKNIFKSY